MLHCALAQFPQEPANQGEDILVVAEMTLRHLQEGDVIDDRDYLDRVDIIRTLGRPVMISNFGEYYRLANYLQRHTSKLIGLVMGVPTLREIFEEKYYTHLAGGILESFGRMFKNDLKVYVHPLLDPDAGVIAATAADFRRDPASSSTSTTSWSRAGTSSRSATTSRNSSSIFSHDVYRKLNEGDPTWVNDVPPNVALSDLPAPPAGLRPREVRDARGRVLVAVSDQIRSADGAGLFPCLQGDSPRSFFESICAGCRWERPVLPRRTPMPRRIAVVVAAFAWVLIQPSIAPGQVPRHPEAAARTGTARRDPLEGLDGYIEDGLKRWEIPGLPSASSRTTAWSTPGVRCPGARQAREGDGEHVLRHGLAEQGVPRRPRWDCWSPRGSSAWDDPAIKHLPWFQMHDPYATRELTVRDLLCHRCGLGTWQGDLIWYASGTLTRREVLGTCFGTSSPNSPSAAGSATAT